MTRSEHDPYEAWMLERWDREAAASDRQDSVGGEAVTAALDRLEALCEAATPGPWRALHEEQYESRVALGDEALAATEVVYDVPTADAAFIAASRAALPALIAVARGLQNEHEERCGCDQPGRIAYCVAGENFSALAALEGGAA